MGAQELAGRLLVATPNLLDPNFRRTVVLILDHHPDGAMGLVLNRPSETAVGDPLPQWREHAVEPAVVFVGGPVRQEAAICLARAAGAPRSEGWQPLFDRLGTVDLARSPGELGVDIDAVRVFAGYAGWGANQLEGEIEAGAWYVLDAGPGDVMCAEPTGLWRSVLRRQPGLLSAVASYPADLSEN
jgi:putative transcriptional regulator